MRIIAAIVFCLFAATAANAEWLKSESRHFTIYSEGAERGLRSFAIKVERFDSVLRKLFHVPDIDTPQKLTIFMLPSQAAAAKASGGGPGVAGRYIANGEGSIAIISRLPSDDKFQLSTDAILFHEYAHHFMIRYFPFAYPAWYVEGFAEFLATVEFTKDGNARRGMPPYYRAYGLIEGVTIPVAKLLSSSVEEMDRSELDPFYGRSWLLVHYLNSTPDRVGQLGKYLAEINSGASSIDAARTAFGDLKQLDRDLRAYVNKPLRYSTEMDPTPLPASIQISTLSPGAAATVMHVLALRRGIDEQELAKLVGALGNAAAKYPASPEPLTLLAEAEYKAGNYAGAIKAADAALALAPNSSRAMLYKGWAMLSQNVVDDIVSSEKWKAARSWVVKANRADTNDPMPLYVYYQSFRMKGETPSALAKQGLARAYQMVPEDGDIRMTYASELASDKKYAEAIRLVETLAYDPHSGPGSAQARSVLKRLRTAQEGKEPGDANLFGDEMENKSGKQVIRRPAPQR